MEIIENKRFESERALYNLTYSTIKNCIFSGEEDGESALKECYNIKVENCKFDLRYPLWHAKNFTIKNCLFSDTARAPLWYCKKGKFKNSKIKSVKAIRECVDINLINCDIISNEFGWKTNKIVIADSSIESEYVLFDAKNISISNLNQKGKYSFQYTKKLRINNSYLDTKDAFWHSKDIEITNSTIKGEYIAWFSENATFKNCTIIGTQPFCYCKNLTLINCKMIDCDLAFEYSSVDADINGTILSIKNPKSGVIRVDDVEEIITDGSIMTCKAKIIFKSHDKAKTITKTP